MMDKGILPFRRELESEDRAESEASAAASVPNSWRKAFGVDDEMPHAYLLLVRFALVSLAGFAFLAAAWCQGWIMIAHRADGTYQSHGIFALFLVGLGLCAHKVWRTSVELNKIKRFDAFKPEP